ncbi:MAG: PD-(D/E)XK nuclease family protein [Chloroflexota bacterium]|nr:PD-(D/E)XK nuclease family protein [Chloroflexota bacterium]
MVNPLVMLKERLPMQWLRERDIDLLICSELNSQGPLRDVFLGGWNARIAHFYGAWVSYHDVDGETDIVASFWAGDNALVLLIENKIDAEFQPEQPQRYRERANRWRDSLGPGAEVETVLLAPEEYFENEGSELFDLQISYEAVIAALAESDDPRTQFLAQTLENGIESHRRGYTPQHSEATTRVWSAIWNWADADAPNLRMDRPVSKPVGAGFIHFVNAEGVSTAQTGRRAKIVYKPEYGNVDLQFSNMEVARLQEAARDILAPDMTVARAAKSASIRIKVPALDFGRPPEGQEEAIRSGIEAAERLRVFFMEEQPLELL